jgi:heat shock protein HslJ
MGIMLRLSSRHALAAACLVSGLITAACASYAPAASSDLVGTRWAVRSIDGRPTQVRAPSVEFAPEDRIRGGGGCNTFSGVYEAAGGAIDVRALGRTEMACETSLMRQEDAFFAVLDRAARYERREDSLVITAEDGRALVLASL